MRGMNRCLLGLAGWLLAVSAPAATLEDVQAQLSGHAVVRGEFTQTRKLAMFKAPLVSNGQFVLARDAGMSWQQTEPFEIRIVLTGNQFRQQYGKQPPQVMKSEDNPVMFFFTRLMLALFQGDTAAMREQFDLSFSEPGEGWRLDLTPRSAPLNTVFSRIRLLGGEYVNEILLTETRGDETAISFSGQNSSPADLTEDEKHAFDF